jgi:hypothetical protein
MTPHHIERYPFGQINHEGLHARGAMSDKLTSNAKVYEIRLKGHLEARWVTWFNGLTITLEEGGDTVLTGPVIDQATLHGLLKKIRDVGLPLLSINCIEPDA